MRIWFTSQKLWLASRPGFTRWSALAALLLLLVVVGASALRVLAYECPSDTITIPRPASGTVLCGKVRIEFSRSAPAPPPPGWRTTYFQLYDSQGTLVEQSFAYGPEQAQTYGAYFLESKLHANGAYSLRFTSIDNDGEQECPPVESALMPVTITNRGYARHHSAAKLTALSVTDYVSSAGGTHPLHGYQRFSVPLASWSYKGRAYDFALIYDSSSYKDLQTLDPVEFAGLQTGNAHWTHSFAQYIDLVQDDAGTEYAVWRTGGRAVAFAKSGSTFTSPDSFHTLTFGGGPITSPEYPIPGGGMGTLQVPYGWFILTDGNGVQYQSGGLGRPDVGDFLDRQHRGEPGHQEGGLHSQRQHRDDPIPQREVPLHLFRRRGPAQRRDGGPQPRPDLVLGLRRQAQRHQLPLPTRAGDGLPAGAV
jgi:hypothetical protein